MTRRCRGPLHAPIARLTLASCIRPERLLALGPPPGNSQHATPFTIAIQGEVGAETVAKCKPLDGFTTIQGPTGRELLRT